MSVKVRPFHFRFSSQENSELEFLVRLIGLAFKSLTLLETKEYYENKVVRLSFSPSLSLSYNFSSFRMLS